MAANWPYKILQIQKASWFGNRTSSAKTQMGCVSWEAGHRQCLPLACQLVINKQGPQQSHRAGYTAQPHPWDSTSASPRAPKDQAPRKRPANYPRAPAVWHASRQKGRYELVKSHLKQNKLKQFIRKDHTACW